MTSSCYSFLGSSRTDPRDSVFTAHLFVSNSEELYRYTDEGESEPLQTPNALLTRALLAGDLTELCRWTVDLAALPKFHQIADENGGGYIEFDLGLQLDSAEVRGVLMTEDGLECGAASAFQTNVEVFFVHGSLTRCLRRPSAFEFLGA